MVGALSCLLMSNSMTLGGRHLDITVIHALGAIDMGYERPGDTLLPEAEWEGFVVDMIEWIAARADFTYSLHSPSGLGYLPMWISSPACQAALPRVCARSQVSLQFAGWHSKRPSFESLLHPV